MAKRSLRTAYGRRANSQQAVARSLRKYGLKPGNYAVHGSSILELNKVRPARDLDIVVTRRTYRRLLKTGEFKRAPFSRRVAIAQSYEGEVAKTRLLQTIPSRRHIRNAQVFGGVPYMKLSTLQWEKRKSYLVSPHRRAKDGPDLQAMRRMQKASSPERTSYMLRQASLKRHRDYRGRFA